MATPINPLPTPPSPADPPADFNTRAFALLGALPAFVTEANAQASGVDAAVLAAETEADAAALKAGEALASANNAAISKTGAYSARDAAVIAKNSAEAALDSFDDRYLGAKAVAPTTDNDGGALLTGALYWDTSLPGMRSWNGSAWVTLPAATKASVGLGNVDNTSDAAKPVSTAQAAAIQEANVHAAVPGSNVGPIIVVTSPHLRVMVWDGVKYVRAPWHMPGMVLYSMDNPVGIRGYLPVRGDVQYQQSDYPDLVERLGLSGAGTFVLYEARGEFIRCLDNGRGIDAGRVHGSAQLDAARNFTGSFHATAFMGTTGRAAESSGIVGASYLGNSEYSSGGGSGNSFATYNLDLSRSVPTANENRPRSIALPTWVSY